MIRRLGLLLVIATYVSVTSALPPCVCTRELKPVCGSDGETYNNMCLLRCQQQASPDLTLHSHGHCRSARQAGDNPDCICTLQYDPVCGANGRTYPNQCAMRCDQRDLEIVHYGECRSKRQANSFCACPFNYAPVCGTNGRTYGNECALKCETNVDIAHRGACRPKREACICPMNYDPVCGTDGRTYGNECAMDCEGTGQITVAYKGPCRHKREVEYEPPACFCTFENDPVCGSNGHTYSNLCALECEGGKVQLAYKGDCKAKREPVQIAKLPTCQCSRIAKPVCGTDGKTYSNPCLLNCIREQREDLDIDHPGPCEDRVKVEDVSPQLSCACARIMQPVCASNGVTFNNECLMRCAGEELTVAKYGRCEA